jgi:hypothetical protein
MRKEWYRVVIIKAELLCYGLKLSEEQKDIIEKTNPYICEKGLVHAVHIRFGGTIINVCVAEKFCANSPYSVKQDNGKWLLVKDDRELGEFTFTPLPDWTHTKIDGIYVGDFASPHADTC